MKAPTVSAYDDASQRWHLIEGDALTLLTKLPDDCVDAIVTDPPYAIGIVGQAWDGRAIAEAVGVAHGPEAFERWTATWARQCRRLLKPGGHVLACGSPRTFHRLVAGIEDAGLEVRDQVLWINGQGVPKSRRLPDGLGTMLKPGYEPVLLARKPFEGTVFDNLEAFGTGALNIEDTRIGKARYWPGNLTLSHSPDCPAALLDGESTGPSRLFYCAKATPAEREAGCDELPLRRVQLYTGARRPPRIVRNGHPTVKPIALMAWLVRLVTPPNGLVLDPFAGSGTTGIAAMLEGRRFVGIEREPAYIDIACARLTHWASGARQ
jgi:DNA modification methylase